MKYFVIKPKRYIVNVSSFDDDELEVVKTLLSARGYTLIGSINDIEWVKNNKSNSRNAL